ncbi:MAG: Dabb family protein [Spirochaetaceae bacterium]|jgi:quinol monooxygenase YgiN|nr:Dabb family protein [Spirochaetaceae bacterium]
MLKHLVLWTLTEKAEAEGLPQTVAKLNASAQNMVGKIPGLITSRVYRNTAVPDAPGEFRNLVFYSEFENTGALAAYQETPLHRAHREMAASYVRNRETIDFEI